MTVRSVFQGQRGLIVSIFASSLFVNVLILTAPLYMIQLFSRVMTSGSGATLITLTIGAALCLLFYFAFDALRQRLAVRLGTRIDVGLGPVVMEALIEDTTLRAQAGIQPLRDLQEVRAFVAGPFFVALMDAPWSLVFVGVIFLFHPALGVLALAGLVILLALGVLGEMSGRNPNREAAALGQTTNRFAEELLRQADLVRAMGNTGALRDRWQAMASQSQTQGALAADRIGVLGSAAKLVRMGLQVAIMALGTWLVVLGELSPGLMMAASILLGRAAAPVEQSISGWRSLLSVRLAKARLQAILDARSTTREPMALPAPEGRLSVEEASVVLPDRQNPMLLGISFDLAPGASLGIIGPSGAGKTTLARALVGLQPLSRGHVRIDDAALTDWPAAQIGSYIGFLPQRVELFQGTVAENIAMLNPEVAPSAIVEAARRAEVHELILDLPQGYNTPVGMGGEMLSAGQRQRIGLARAFLGDRRLIVLDEPNANLDPDGEEALARAVANATARGAIVVIVSHRLPILRRVSHVAVMEAGRLVRFGPTAEVMTAAVQPVAAQNVGQTSTIHPFASPRPGQRPDPAPFRFHSSRGDK